MVALMEETALVLRLNSRAASEDEGARASGPGETRPLPERRRAAVVVVGR